MNPTSSAVDPMFFKNGLMMLCAPSYVMSAKKLTTPRQMMNPIAVRRFCSAAVKRVLQ